MNLVEMAKEAAKYSYSPYSHFTVGAALKTKSGKIYTGCNIENGAYTPTCCAERTAFVKAISEGETEFEEIAIVGGTDGHFDDYCFPCGVCRQFISEFCSSDFKITMGKDNGEIKTYELSKILPFAFKL